MASIHYYLKGSLSKKKLDEVFQSDTAFLENYMNTKLQIICSVATYGKRLKVFTGKKIEPLLWDFEKERANTLRYKKLGVTLNKFLNDYESAIALLTEQNENSGKLTNSTELRKLLPRKDNVRKIVESHKVKFAEHMERFLREHKTQKGFPLRPNTKKKYRTLEKYLAEFCIQERRNLHLNELDLDFVSSFQNYLNKKSEKENGKTESEIEPICDSTKAKYLDGFKTFIKFYQNPQRGLIPYYDLSEINISQGEGEIYVLPLKRVIELQRKKFSSERLNSFRDQFCFMCWTGQRFGDYVDMKKSDLVKDEYGELVWRLSATKIVHGTLLTVPLIEYAVEILKRYKGGSLPIPTITNQKFNEALKELGQEANLDFEVKRIQYYNGVAKIVTLPFYEVLTAHVARKSYITNSLMLGVPERIVREVSGHKDEKSFSRYVKLADRYKTAAIQFAYSKENVERVLKLIGEEEIFYELSVEEVGLKPNLLAQA